MMNINIPPDSEEWLFCDADGGRLWSFRYPPPCEVGDTIVFRFGGRVVATATVCRILPPGANDTFAHHGKRFLSGHKVVWLQSSFVDLRENRPTVDAIDNAETERRRVMARARRRKVG